jgi:hypothetical protein
MKLKGNPKKPLQWALDLAGKTEIPYAAKVLHDKKMEIVREWDRINDLERIHPKKETVLTLKTLQNMGRELERAAEIVIIGL